MVRLRTRRRRARVVDVPLDALEANPYPFYRWLRENAPVAYTPALNGRVLVATWEAAESVLKNDEAFSARIPEPSDPPANVAGSLLFVDGDAHARAREAMQPPCQPRPAAARAETDAAAAVDELLDRLEPAGEGEFVEDFAWPLSTALIGGVIGLENVSDDDLRAWVEPTIPNYLSGVVVAEAHAASRRFDEAVLEAAGRISASAGGASPTDSVLAAALAPRGAAGALSEQELLANVKMFAAGGVHEFRDLVAHTVVGLLSRPDQFAELRGDPALARRALDEAARWASPVGLVSRLATADTEIAGVLVPAGTLVSPLLASANRDESRWSDPGRFDLHLTRACTSRSPPASISASGPGSPGRPAPSPSGNSQSACPGSGSTIAGRSRSRAGAFASCTVSPLPGPDGAYRGAVADGFIRVCAVEEVADDVPLGFLAPGAPDPARVLVRVDGSVHALGGVCPHQGADLSEGIVERGILWCPIHSSGFDCRTGAATHPPAPGPLRTYAVRIVDGDVHVSLESKTG